MALSGVNSHLGILRIIENVCFEFYICSCIVGLKDGFVHHKCHITNHVSELLPEEVYILRIAIIFYCLLYSDFRITNHQQTIELIVQCVWQVLSEEVSTNRFLVE